MSPQRSAVADDFRAGADAIPAFVFVGSDSGELQFANRFFCASTGWSQPEMRDFISLVHPDDRKQVVDSIDYARRTRGRQESEFRFQYRDGSYRTLYTTGAPLIGRDGSFQGIYGIAIDIEDRIQARAALVESERRLDTFLATVPQIVWTADAAGNIDWYNDRWYEYTGQTHEEAAGWGWQAVHHPEDFPRVMERWPQCIASGEAFEMEFRLLGRDGYRWFLTRVSPLRNESGTVVRWFGSNTDIDDRKRSEQRLVAILQQVFRNDRAPVLEPLRIDTLYLPAEPSALVGGDWHDAFPLGDGRCFISIGDVAGHGLDAASTAARLRQTVAAFALEDPDPARILERTNRVCAAQTSTLATACVAVIDPATLVITYASAGHPPPIFVSVNESAESGELGGVPLGAMPEVGATTHTRTLTPDAHAIFYTDGLTEYSRSPIEGERRLLIAAENLVEASPREPARWLRERVIGAAAIPDDVAVVVVAAGPPRPAGTRPDRRWVWRFHSNDPSIAQRSRRDIALRFALAATDDPQGLADSELIVGELLANTVEHAPGLVEVEFEREGDDLVLTVSDSGPGLVAGPKSHLPSETFSESGRGLWLVRTLAREVRFGRTSRGGTLVRVVLPLAPLPFR